MDNLFPAASKLILSFVLGAVIGLERDASHSEDLAKEENHTTKPSSSIAGLRTFSLIAVLGALSGFLASSYEITALAVAIATFALIAIFYILQSIQSDDHGMTTEVVMIYCYVVGFLISVELLPAQLLIALSIILILILSRKKEIRKMTFGLQREELNAFVSYALIALVILPFLPNRGFALQDIEGFTSFLSTYGISLGEFASTEIINPFKLWLIVALITGIDIAGYTLGKSIGKTKGRLVSSLVGGFVSSTATTQSLAQESKKSKQINSLVMSAVFANFVSFFPIFLLIASINGSFLVQLTPILLALLLSSLGMGLVFAYISRQDNDSPPSLASTKDQITKSIFSLRPAISFALLFMAVRIITQAALILVGQSGFLFASALAGLTGIDAATINVATLANEQISMDLAVTAFILINAVNLAAKTFYSFLQGKREFALKFGLSMAVAIISSLIVQIFI